MASRRGIRLWIMVQLAAVVGLLIASAATLWRAGTVVVERERRRAQAADELPRAEDAVVSVSAPALALLPTWPDTLDPFAWQALDEWLRETGRQALAPFPGVEAGFFVPSSQRFLGQRPPDTPREPLPGQESTGQSADPLADPRSELVEAQIRQTLERSRPVSILVERNRELLAIRAAPLQADGRTIAAVWSLRRIESRESAERPLRAYEQAARLALGGLGLALGLTLCLALTVRRLSREKQRIQADLRRQERLAALGKLLAGVAHEVRNPLAGIRLTAQLWQRGLHPDDQSIADLIDEVDRIEALVSRLLHFSRTEPERLLPCDVNALVGEVVRLAGPQAQATGVRIATNLAPDLPPVAIDEQAIVQLLRNLLANGIQAMPHGGLVRVETRALTGAERIELRVRDQGPGLSDEVRAHLFEPFFTTRPEGTGLGLALAREIALAHGGELIAADHDGTPGALFVLRLPLRRHGGQAHRMTTLSPAVLAHEPAHPGG